MLLLAEEPVHGYELIGRLSEFGVEQGGMDPSILYRMLRMLEREGLASSKLDPSGTGPARKVYYLTDEGREVLSMWAAKIEETGSYLRKFSERYGKLPDSSEAT
jgi:DNA-binding PadR family transcriptional regulator